ncbi:hypothetical protein R3I94_000277 [Phoxinus phoxinus]
MPRWHIVHPPNVPEVIVFFCYLLYNIKLLTDLFCTTKASLDHWRLYVRRGAERAAKNMGNGLGIEDVYISWFGLAGLRWKSLLP